MNIIGINPINSLCSKAKNTQNSIIKNTISNLSIKNENPQRVSLDSIQTYCPNIHFSGINFRNRHAKKQSNRDYQYLCDLMERRHPSEFIRELSSFDRDKKFLSLCSGGKNNGETIISKFVDKFPEEYSAVTNDLKNYQKSILLQISDESKWSVAHRLASSAPSEYVKSTECLDDKQKFGLLLLSDKAGTTVAHKLAHSPEDFIKATESLSEEQLTELLDTRDRFGRKVEYILPEY